MHVPAGLLYVKRTVTQVEAGQKSGAIESALPWRVCRCRFFKILKFFFTPLIFNLDKSSPTGVRKR
jgi:hypothetical protein